MKFYILIFLALTSFSFAQNYGSSDAAYRKDILDKAKIKAKIISVVKKSSDLIKSWEYYSYVIEDPSMPKDMRFIFYDIKGNSSRVKDAKGQYLLLSDGKKTWKFDNKDKSILEYSKYDNNLKNYFTYLFSLINADKSSYIGLADFVVKDRMITPNCQVIETVDKEKNTWQLYFTQKSGELIGATRGKITIEIKNIIIKPKSFGDYFKYDPKKHPSYDLINLD